MGQSRISGEKDKFKNILLDQQHLKRTPEQAAAIIVGKYIEMIHNTYEGGLRWMILSKMGFILTKQLNDVDIYQPNDGSASALQKMKDLYTTIVKKKLSMVGKDLNKMKCSAKIDKLHQKNWSSRKKAHVYRKIVNDPSCRVGRN